MAVPKTTATRHRDGSMQAGHVIQGLHNNPIFFASVLFPVVSQHSPQSDVRFKKRCRDGIIVQSLCMFCLHTAIPTPSCCFVLALPSLHLLAFLENASMLYNQHLYWYKNAMYKCMYVAYIWFMDEKLNTTATGIHETSTCTITSSLYDINKIVVTPLRVYFSRRDNG